MSGFSYQRGQWKSHVWEGKGQRSSSTPSLAMTKEAKRKDSEVGSVPVPSLGAVTMPSHSSKPSSPFLSMLGTSCNVQWFLEMFTPFLAPGLPIKVKGAGPRSFRRTHLIPTVLGEHQRQCTGHGQPLWWPLPQL